jgi:biotin synthase
MCITLPGQVVAVGLGWAEIEARGNKRKVRLLDSDFKIGDWVLSTDEYLVRKISEVEAEEIASLFSYYKSEPTTDHKLSAILDASLSRDLSREEIEFLLGLEKPEDLESLYAQANVARLATALNHICVHGIIEFSNYCKNDCHYCGLRSSNTVVNRCRLSPEELIETAVEAINLKGYKILVLQSGEDDYYDLSTWEKIISEIKQQARAFIYLSIGARSVGDYRKLKQAGANGILMRFETSNKDLYHQLRPGHELDQRIELIKELKALGFILATGFMIGLPDQSNRDLANDLLLLKELNPFMPSIGPLVPSSQTPLAESLMPNKEQILKVIAITRLIIPQARLPITTAMETLYGENFRQEAFLAGANSLMLNLTPEKLRDNYYIYENKFFDEEKKFAKWALFKGDLSYQMLEEELKTKI